MGAAMTIGTIFGGILSAVMLGLVKDEIAAWLPSLIKSVIRFSANRLNTQESRERYEMEWAAHVADYPGKLSQLFQALLCTKASFGLRPISRYLRILTCALLVVHTCGAFVIPNVSDYYFPECACGNHLERTALMLVAVAPLTMLNLAFHYFVIWAFPRLRPRRRSD